tara:strand:+ start:51081 stop:52364 length:1284 start_codon:yes stop_codon:yes gene_type:complete
MRVWLAHIGEAPIAPRPGNRPMRLGLLAGVLRRQGHEVTWISSRFDHGMKQQRSAEFAVEFEELGIELVLLNGPGYRRNVSLERMWDHWCVARSFRAIARELPRPDVVLASLPTAELALGLIDEAKRHGAPVLVDVRDWWPDIFYNVLPDWQRPLARVGLTPLEWMYDRACSRADGVLGITPDFMRWGLRRARRERGRNDAVFPIGYSRSQGTEDERRAATEYWREQGVDLESKVSRVVFVGSISNAHDVQTVARAAALLGERGTDCEFVFCGDGDMRGKVEEVAGQSERICFPGWVDRSMVFELLRASDVGVVPLADRPDFRVSVNNKTTEYLAAEMALLVSPANSLVGQLVNEYGCGLAYSWGDDQDLADRIEESIEDGSRLKTMKRNSGRLFEEMFDAERVYPKFANHLMEVAGRFSQNGSGNN